jgi:hypothetical protein
MTDAAIFREKGYPHNVVHDFDQKNLVKTLVLTGLSGGVQVY